jgi:hypothetical protein
MMIVPALFAGNPALIAGSTAVIANSRPVISTNLTIVLDFNGPHSQQSVDAMERETQGILKGAGVHLDWKSREEAAGSSFADLVVVRFNGACQLPPPPLYDELGEIGPLASTYETDGQVQPFSEVSCDRVGAFVRSGLHGSDLKRGDLLIGRALGRVVAHELVHMLTGAKGHSHEGVFKPGLTVQNLVAGELPLSPGDIERLRSRP